MSKKIGITILKAAVTVSIIAFIIHRLGWRHIVSAIAKADMVWLFAALGLFILSGVLGVQQWRILLANKGIQLTYRRAFVLYYVGMFFNNFMFGMVAGDAVKVALIRSNSGNIKGGFAATFLDRFAGLWAMMGFAIFGSIILLNRGMINESRLATAFIALIVAFVGFTIICAFIVSQRLQRLSFRLLDMLPIPAKERIRGIIKEVILEVHDRHLLVPVALLSTLIQLMRIVVHILCAAALGLLTMANFQYFFIFVPFMAVLMLIPLPFGIKESIGGSLFILAGFSPDSPEQPLVMEFLASLIGIAASLIGGVFFVTRKLKTTGDLPVK
ncbi:MAG: lysylphosphatidylglycerol synthase transmembrane domain-containing protein [Chitinispirillaceae bacterium]